MKQTVAVGVIKQANRKIKKWVIDVVYKFDIKLTFHLFKLTIANIIIIIFLHISCSQNKLISYFELFFNWLVLYSQFWFNKWKCCKKLMQKYIIDINFMYFIQICIYTDTKIRNISKIMLVFIFKYDFEDNLESGLRFLQLIFQNLIL